MINQNKKISVAELDFDAIKSNIKTYLEGQATFADYDFEGAGLSVILDILAYNTHYNALYTNLAVNESFLDSASKRSSIVSRAKEIGYVPYSATGAVARVNLTVTGTLSTPATITMAAYTPFSTTIDGTAYNFYNTGAAIAVLSGSTYTFTNVDIKEGTPLTFRYTVADGTQFIIPNIDVDLSTLTVRVQDNASSSVFETFNNQENITELDGTSAVYFIKEIEGQLYELEFGNGTIGKALSSGNVVTLSYMTTNKDAANGARIFSYQGPTILGGSTAVTTVLAAINGSDLEQMDSIKYNAPRSYTSQNRAVTVDDYKSLIFKSYPEAQTVNVWGGEDNVPAQYGKVFLSIKPKTTDYLTDAQKSLIITEILKSKNVVSITPEIVNPEYINLEITTSVYYNPRITVRSSNDIRDLVIQTIQNYNDEHLNSFDGIFRFSNLSSLIDNTEDSIISNITTIKFHREIDVAYNTNQTYTLNIGNPIYGSGVPEESITSTGFYIPGNDNVMYLEDKPIDTQIGTIRQFYFVNDVKTYVRDFGSVNYVTGTILLNELTISGIDTTLSPVFELIMKPQSNDVVSIRNQLVYIPNNQINVNVIIDQVATGDQAGGANYIFTSSRN
jgi:hypothetical protein